MKKVILILLSILSAIGVYGTPAANNTTETVYLCEGDCYVFYGDTLCDPGNYTKTVNGTTYHLMLRYHIPFRQVIDTIISGNQFVWRGQTIKKSGHYRQRYSDINGCDSTYELNIIFDKEITTVLRDTACQDVPFFFGGQMLTETGIYFDSLKTVTWKDSVVALMLIVAPRYDYYDTAKVCPGPYRWQDSTYTKKGDYDTTYTSVYGCDSTYHLHLEYLPAFSYEEWDTLSCSRPYIYWHGQRCSKPGNYSDRNSNIYGCDSTYLLHLQWKITDEIVNICAGDSVMFKGETLKKPGVYYDTLKCEGGLDSVRRLMLNVLRTYHFYDTVTVCQGSHYDFRGKDVCHEGTYFDSLRTTEGCDSIYELYLNVATPFHQIEYETVCTAGYFRWRNHSIIGSGTYFDTIKSGATCDSIYELRITFSQPKDTVVYHEICDRDTFWYKGIGYTTDSEIFDTMRTTEGCDSIVRVELTVLPSVMLTRNEKICYGDSYFFNGENLNLTGTYYDTLQDYGGCYYIVRLNLEVVQPTFVTDYDTVCTMGPYIWHNKTIYESGIYYDSAINVTGCDSIHKLVLVRHEPCITETRYTICKGGSYHFRGESLTKSGIYYDTLQTIYGCDSTVKLILNVMPNSRISDTVTICNGDYYMFRGRKIIYAGTYYDSLRSSEGCDSIYEVIVRVAPKFHNIDYDTVCTNRTYMWHGRHLNRTGTYFDSLSSTNGCDSIYELRLIINPIPMVGQYLEFCNGTTYRYRGKDYSSSGTYYDTLKMANGCDSILKLTVSVSPTYLFSDTVTICQGGTYSFRGRTLSTPGIYHDTLQTVNSGCDSIYELVLNVVSPYLSIEYDTICSNGSYRWHNKTLTETGVYYDSLRNATNCDSIYELHLLVFPEYTNEVRVNLCQGQSYRLNGRLLTTQGIYYDTLQTVHGCDSVTKVILNIFPTHITYDTAHICSGESYYFKGISINREGTYRDTMRSANGCDSIFQLFVKVEPSFHFIETDTVCTTGIYTWRDKDLTASGVYYDSLLSSTGCDSVYELRLTVFQSTITTIHEEICQGTTLMFRGKVLTEAGTYYDTLVRSRNGCDSIIKLVVSIMPDYIFSQNATICENETFLFRGRPVYQSGTYYDSLLTVTGCDSIYRLQLTVKKKNRLIIDTVVCSNEPYFFNAKAITQSGIYYDTVKTAEGCDSFLELHITYSVPTITVINKTICQNQHFTTPTGKILNVTGIFYDTLINSAGCDSVFEIILNVIDNYHVYDTAYVIRGQSYFYRGIACRNEGFYYDTAYSFSSCDTFFQLLLIYEPYLEVHLDTIFCDNNPFKFRGRIYNQTTTDTLLLPSNDYYVTDTLLIINTIVYPHAETYLNDSTCDGRAYMFGGSMRTTSGTYRDSLLTVNGCDSVVILKLMIFDKMVFVDSASVCETEPYFWHGRRLYQSGVYYDTLINAECGCNEYYEFIFTYLKETKLINANGTTDKVIACGDDLSYTITPQYIGETPSRYTITYDGIMVSHSNDITNGRYDGTSITVPMPRDGNNRIVRPDKYTVTLYIGNEHCDATPYIRNFDLHVDYPSSILDQHFKNVVSVFNSDHNGGYNFSGYKWYVNGSVVQGATESNLYLKSLKPNDEVYAELRRTTENYFVPTCPIIIEDLGPEPQEYPVMIGGTYFMPGNTQARLKSKEQGIYRLYNMQGMLISSGDIDTDDETLVTLPSVSGCYLLWVKTETSLQTFKLIVR